MHTTDRQHIVDILHRPTYSLAAREEIHRPDGYAGGAGYRIALVLSVRRLGPHDPSVVQHGSGHPSNVAYLFHHIPHEYHHLGDCRPLRVEHAALRRDLAGRTTIFWPNDGREETSEGVDIGMARQRDTRFPDMGVGLFRRRDGRVEGPEILGGDGYEGARDRGRRRRCREEEGLENRASHCRIQRNPMLNPCGIPRSSSIGGDNTYIHTYINRPSLAVYKGRFILRFAKPGKVPCSPSLRAIPDPHAKGNEMIRLPKSSEKKSESK